MLTIKDQIKELLENSEFKSMRQLAIHLGISPNNLENNLSGRFNISSKRMIALAQALNVSVDKIARIFYPEMF